MTDTIEATPKDLPEQYQAVQHRRAKIEDLDDRTILLRAVPYDVEVPVDVGLVEAFEPAAFRGATKDPGRVKLWSFHSDTPQGRIAGNAVEVVDSREGVDVRARFANTPTGDELRTLAIDGVLDEASIEFRAIPQAMQVRRAGDNVVHVRHKRAHLLGVALVPEGAYGRDALVLSVRDIRAKAIEKARADALARLNALTH